MAAHRYGRRRERGVLVAIGHLLNELRYPTTSRGKVIAASLAAIVFSLISLYTVGGFLLARVLIPPHSSETIDPTEFLGNAQRVEFQGPDNRTRNGWFFPGLRGAPVIVICHGYRSNRQEILTLGTSLQQHRYNVFAFNFAGHGDSPVGYATFGYQESEELRAVLRLLAQRKDVDSNRIGLWGYSLGAYAALSVAQQSEQVKALVLDSVYASPSDLLRLELGNSGAESIPWLGEVTLSQFRLLAYLYHDHPDPRLALDALAGMPKLFVSGNDAPGLATFTQELYDAAPGPKELLPLPRTNMASLGDMERRNYENQIVTFFLRTLPLVAARVRR